MVCEARCTRCCLTAAQMRVELVYVVNGRRFTTFGQVNWQLFLEIDLG